MISHKHKCIFIHIPKAAGTSIENVFLEDLGLDMKNRHSLLIGKNTNKTIGPRRVSHLLAKEYVDLHFISQALFDEYFKFAFIRNPYDRLYSTYKYRKFDDYLTFDSYIKLKLESFIFSPSEGFFFKPQHEYLYRSEKCLVDFVGRFENLEEDFRYVQKKLNLLHASLKHHNKSKPSKGIIRKIRIIGKIIKDYSAWPYLSSSKSNNTLSHEAKNLILKYYIKDFETFNYEI